MGKIIKRSIFSLLSVLTVITFLFVWKTTEVKADTVKASGKTVRVATEKQLKKALKESKVSTIVLRTSSYKDITIKSGTAKKKEIVIDAPNAVITNTARFKKVEVIKAKEYIEAVSGNTVKLSGDAHIQVKEGVSVKKLVLGTVPVYYDIGKNGSIKSIKIADKNHKSSFDKKTRTLTFETVGIWTSYDSDYYGTTENLVTEEYPIKYTAVLDKSGRILKASFAGWATEQRDEYRYDADGNRIEWKQYDESSPEKVPVSWYEYIYEGNRLVEEIDHSYDPDLVTYKKEYDKDGRLSAVCNSGLYFRDDVLYTYDDSGLLIGEKTTKMWFSGDGRLSSRKSIDTAYTYDRNGFLLTEDTYLVDDHMKNINTYEYDKAKNLVRETRLSKTLTGKADELINMKYDILYKYDELGVLTGSYYPEDNEDME